MHNDPQDINVITVGVGSGIDRHVLLSSFLPYLLHSFRPSVNPFFFVPFFCFSILLLFFHLSFLLSILPSFCPFFLPSCFIPSFIPPLYLQTLTSFFLFPSFLSPSFLLILSTLLHSLHPLFLPSYLHFFLPTFRCMPTYRSVNIHACMLAFFAYATARITTQPTRFKQNYVSSTEQSWS